MALKHIPHIKKNTVGTSNELSFDVLDAARNELDSKKSKSTHGSFGIKLPKPSQGSSAGIGDTSTLTAQDEISQRKEQRRTRTWKRRAVIVVVLIALIAGAGMLAYSVYSEHRDFSTRFNELVGDFVETDKVLVTVDKLMGNPLDEQAADERASVEQEFTGVVRRLEQIDETARGLSSAAPSDQAGSAVARVSEAANARISMTRTAKEAFELSEEAARQMTRAKEIWDMTLDADQLARKAVESANNAYNQTETQESQEKLEEAKDMFESAKSQVTQLEYECEGLSLASQAAYIDKRVEALGYALVTGEHLLAGNRQAAIESNDAYNRADQEAARMAASLPLSLVDPVKESFEKRMDELVSAYQHSREIVSESDAVIRDYLGEHR